MLPSSSLLRGAGCQLSTQQLKERAVMSGGTAGAGRRHLGARDVCFLWRPGREDRPSPALTGSRASPSPTAPPPPSHQPDADRFSCFFLSFLSQGEQSENMRRSLGQLDVAWGMSFEY